MDGLCSQCTLYLGKDGVIYSSEEVQPAGYLWETQIYTTGRCMDRTYEASIDESKVDRLSLYISLCAVHTRGLDETGTQL